MSEKTSSIIEARQVTKTYRRGRDSVHALQSISFALSPGDFAVVYGPSGSGKSTLLLALGGMLRPSSGTVSFRGEDIYTYSTLKRNRYRKQRVGFIFQKFFLMPYLTAMDNIRLALAVRGYHEGQDDKILEVASRFGLSDRLMHRPDQLSVGEQQRVAMARAVVAQPELLLADEPTGNLDRGNSEILAEFLTQEHRRGTTIVVVTHDETMLPLGNRTVELRSGKLTSEEATATPGCQMPDPPQPREFES